MSDEYVGKICNKFKRKVLREKYSGKKNVLNEIVSRKVRTLGCSKQTALDVLFCDHVADIVDCSSPMSVLVNAEDRQQFRSYERG